MMRMTGNAFPTIIAPILILFSYGYIAINYHSMGTIYEWTGYCLTGCLRAVGGMSLGAVCSYAANNRKAHKLTKLGKGAVSVIECGLLVLSLHLMNKHAYTLFDFVQVLLFAILIYIAFSEHSVLNDLFDNKICYFLGKASNVIFLTHFVAFYYRVFPYPVEWSAHYISYFFVAMLLSIANYTIVECGKKMWGGIEKIKRYFVQIG